MPRPAAWYRSPIDLPEATSGKLSVRHVRLTGEVPVIGLRQAFLRGKRPAVVTIPADQPLRIHELVDEDNGVWMSDRPEELQQIAETLDDLDPSLHVLVGGLGLGILATVLSQRPNVTKITVVERSPDVVALCTPVHPKVNVMTADIAAFLSTCPHPFYTYMLDTWQGTNEGTWWTEVMPLRRTIARRWGQQRVWCWAEDIMLGQCFRSALSSAGRGWYYRALPAGIKPKALGRFFRDVGLPAWEARYGRAVDAVLAEP